jgi:hypothetical protein
MALAGGLQDDFVDRGGTAGGSAEGEEKIAGSPPHYKTYGLAGL